MRLGRFEWTAAGALFFPLMALMLVGCRKESVELQREIADATGTNRLALYATVGRSSLSRFTDCDFHSLVWREQVGTNWTARRTIDQVTFQIGSTRHRWVNDIASFDGVNGVAVIKVGEESPPIATSTSIVLNVVYSWREWSMLTNMELRLLRICKDPFEKY